MIMKDIFDAVRSACREVAARASRVHIDYDHIPGYAASLPVRMTEPSELDPGCHYLGKKAETLAFLLTLDTINFGSGYFPHLRKRPGMSGYFTIASSLNDVYKSRGCLTAENLAGLTRVECTGLFDQDPANQVIRELMGHFQQALNDLGRYLLESFNGDFAALVEEAGSSADRLVRILAEMPCFQDVETYGGLQVPFYKRAQITAADLSIAFEGKGWGYFKDLNRLTIFADNLVPHVLRIDGILAYEQALLDRIAVETPIPSGSLEEVEIRACAVHAVELIKNEILKRGHSVNSSDIDHFLWNRGRLPRYKAVPRHRTRCVFY